MSNDSRGVWICTCHSARPSLRAARSCRLRICHDLRGSFWAPKSPASFAPTPCRYTPSSLCTRALCSCSQQGTASRPKPLQKISRMGPPNSKTSGLACQAYMHTCDFHQKYLDRYQPGVRLIWGQGLGTEAQANASADPAAADNFIRGSQRMPVILTPDGMRLRAN